MSGKAEIMIVFAGVGHTRKGKFGTTVALLHAKVCSHLSMHVSSLSLCLHTTVWRSQAFWPQGGAHTFELPDREVYKR